MHQNIVRLEARYAPYQNPAATRGLAPLHIAISPAAEEYLKKRDHPIALDYIAALG